MAKRNGITKKSVNRPDRLSAGILARHFQRFMERRQEKKVYSTQLSGATVSPTGFVISLSTFVVEGADINQRSGTTIRALHQTFKYTLSTSTVSQSARFIIFRDLFNTGTTPTVTEVLPTTGMLSHFSDTREIQQRRYHILLDKIVDVSIAGDAIKTNRAEIGFKGNVQYNGSTAVATANGRGAIFLLVIGNSNTAVYDYDWQLHYTDS